MASTTDYTVTGNFQLTDGMTIALAPTVVPVSGVTPCGSLSLQIAAVRPPQGITGVIDFRPTRATSVAASGRVHPRLFWDFDIVTGAVRRSRRGLDGRWHTDGRPTTGEAPQTYALNGAPVGRYRNAIKASNQTSGAGRRGSWATPSSAARWTRVPTRTWSSWASPRPRQDRLVPVSWWRRPSSAGRR